MRRLHRRRGISLAEVLVAAAFLGICSAALTDTATQANANIARAERRMTAFAALKNGMEIGICDAKAANLDSYVSWNVTLSGGKTATVSIQPNPTAYTGVVQVQGMIVWSETRGSRTYTERMGLEVYVRSPDVN